MLLWPAEGECKQSMTRVGLYPLGYTETIVGIFQFYPGSDGERKNV